MPKTIEKCAFFASKDAGSCCAIREFLQRIVGPLRPAEGFSRSSFEGRLKKRKSACSKRAARHRDSENVPETSITEKARRKNKQ